jgi:hypothetical protein
MRFSRSVYSFCVAVGLDCTPGLVGLNCGQVQGCRIPGLYHFGQAANSRRLVKTYDASNVYSLALSLTTGWPG